MRIQHNYLLPTRLPTDTVSLIRTIRDMVTSLAHHETRPRVHSAYHQAILMKAKGWRWTGRFPRHCLHFIWILSWWCPLAQTKSSVVRGFGRSRKTCWHMRPSRHPTSIGESDADMES
jgi:hypothetical protein